MFRICSSVELERDSAKVEAARSNRARSTKTFLISDFRLQIDLVINLTFRLPRPWTNGQSSIFNQKSKMFHAGVAQLGGGASLRN